MPENLASCKKPSKGGYGLPFASPHNGKPIIEELDNGSKIIGLEHEGIDTGIAIAFPWGARHDQYVPHMLEHIVFQKRRHNKSPCADSRIEELGGFFTGSTEDDKLVFSVLVIHKNLRETLEIIKESLINPPIAERILRKEKRVIEGELQKRVSEPSYYLEILRDKLILGEDHPLYTAPETISGIRSLTAERLREQQRRYLGARNMHIGLVGPDIRDSMQAAKEIMADFPKKGRKIERFGLNKVTRYVKTSRRAGFKDCVASITVPVPGYGLEERYAVEIIANLLAGTVEEYESRARLWQKIRDREGKMYHTGVQHAVYPGLGLLEISLEGILPRHLNTVRQMMEDEMERLCAHTIGDRQLEGARNSLMLNELRSNRGKLEDTASQIVDFVMGGEDPSYESYARGLMNVTPADIISVAKKYFSAERRFIGTVKPA